MRLQCQLSWQVVPDLQQGFGSWTVLPVLPGSLKWQSGLQSPALAEASA